MLTAILYIAVSLGGSAVIAFVIAIGRARPNQAPPVEVSRTAPIPTAPQPPPPEPVRAPAATPAAVAVPPPPAREKMPPPPPPAEPVEGDDQEEVTMQTLMVSSIVPRLRETSALGSANRLVNLKKPVITIGRAKDNDIVLKEEAASGHHCRLEKHSVSYRLVDLNSTNKTWVNGAEKQNVVLRNGDQIKVGDTTFIFELFGDRG